MSEIRIILITADGPAKIAGGGKVTGERHSMAGCLCAACNCPITDGQLYTFVILGPGADAAERDHAAAGGKYIAMAIAVHNVCATGVE
jgi:hypothetical protein